MALARTAARRRREQRHRLTGRLAEYVDRLDVSLRGLTGPQSDEQWLAALARALDLLVDVPEADAWQLGQARRELAAAVEHGGDTQLRLADVRAMLRSRLAGRPTRANFRTGELTVCTMVPMRSVPHRVVVLLGLDDDVSPRHRYRRRRRAGPRSATGGTGSAQRGPTVAARRHHVRERAAAAVLQRRRSVNGTPARPRCRSRNCVTCSRRWPGRTWCSGIRCALRSPQLRSVGPRSFDHAALGGARAAQQPSVPRPRSCRNRCRRSSPATSISPN